MIEKDFKNVTKFKCPLCDKRYDDFEDAQKCMIDFLCDSHSPEAVRLTVDFLKCGVCNKEFDDAIEADNHEKEGFCELKKAARHPGQKTITEVSRR